MAGTITTAATNSYKNELARLIHNFTATTGHVFKIALLKPESVIATNYGASTTVYTALGTDEVANGSGYTTGGITLTNVTPQTTGTTAHWSFSNSPQWTGATFDTQGAVIYNDTASGKPVVAVIRSGASPISLVAGTLTITFPTNDATNAVLRIA